MILPKSPFTWQLLLLLSALAFGLWVFVFPRRRRFELLYFDFAIGTFLAAALAAYTLGSLGFDGFLFEDDLAQAGRRPIAYAVAAGVLVNLANTFYVASTRLSGIYAGAIFFFGTAVVGGLMAGLLHRPITASTSRGLLLTLLTLGAIASVYVARSSQLQQLSEQQGISLKKSLHRLRIGLILAAAGGILAITCLPLIERARVPGYGLGPYSLAFLMAVGIGLSTVVFNLFFMNFPVEGKPLELSAYWHSRWRNHILGGLGGLIWFAGLLAWAVALHTSEQFAPDRSVPALAAAGAGVVAAIGAVLIRRELQPLSMTSLSGLVAALLLYALAVGWWFALLS